MRNSAKLGALVIAAAALTACTIVPIQNVSEAPVASASGRPLSNDQVRAAIVRAGSGLGWQFRDEGPNMLVGTLNLRTHTAVVEVPYNSRTYGVRYRSSVNLNEANGSIHKNYNGWIQNLTRDINAQLSAAS
jgi:hypothetical protein